MRTLVLTCLVLAACDDGDKDTDTAAGAGDTDPGADTDSVPDDTDDMDTDNTGDTDTDEAPLTFQDDVDPILSSRCVMCHLNSNTNGGFNFDGGLDDLLKNSNDLPDMPYIDPEDSSNSYLFHKISGTQLTVDGDGSQMPLQGGLLSDAQIDLIGQWIDEGAMP